MEETEEERQSKKRKLEDTDSTTVNPLGEKVGAADGEANVNANAGNNDKDDTNSKTEEFHGLGEVWEGMFNRLKAYKREHGDCRVPKNHEDQKLCRWVCYQRYMHNCKPENMPECRVKALKSIGFEFYLTNGGNGKQNRDSWEDKFQRLIAFKEQHGTCLVPYTYKPDRALGFWVSKVRKDYKKGQLHPDKVRMLNLIDFNWKPLNGRPMKSKQVDQVKVNLEEDTEVSGPDWNIRFLKLKLFYQQHGHCNVSLQSDPQLSFWANNQRNLYRHNKLSPQQIENLKSIEYVFPMEESWEVNFSQLQAYPAAGKDCNNPDDPKLLQWVTNQRLRYKRKQLSQVHIDKLQSIVGFSWQTRSQVKERGAMIQHRNEVKKLKDDKTKLEKERNELQQETVKLRRVIESLRENNWKLTKADKAHDDKKPLLNEAVELMKEDQAVSARENKMLEEKLKRHEEQLKLQSDEIKAQGEQLRQLLEQYQKMT